MEKGAKSLEMLELRTMSTRLIGTMGEPWELTEAAEGLLKITTVAQVVPGRDA